MVQLGHLGMHAALPRRQRVGPREPNHMTQKFLDFPAIFLRLTTRNCAKVNMADYQYQENHKRLCPAGEGAEDSPTRSRGQQLVELLDYLTVLSKEGSHLEKLTFNLDSDTHLAMSVHERQFQRNAAAGAGSPGLESFTAHLCHLTRGLDILRIVLEHITSKGLRRMEA